MEGLGARQLGVEISLRPEGRWEETRCDGFQLRLSCGAAGAQLRASACPQRSQAGPQVVCPQPSGTGQQGS